MAIPVKCNQCEKSFKTEALLDIHKEIPSAQITCEHCKKSFKSKKVIQDHKAHVHVKLIDKYCRFCKKVYAAKNTFMKHMRMSLHMEVMYRYLIFSSFRYVINKYDCVLISVLGSSNSNLVEP